MAKSEVAGEKPAKKFRVTLPPGTPVEVYATDRQGAREEFLKVCGVVSTENAYQIEEVAE